MAFNAKASEGIVTMADSHEGGTILFVTRKFDLILPGRQWSSNADGSFVAGNGVMVVRSLPALSITQTGGPPTRALTTNDQLLLSFPNIAVSILQGKTLKVNDTNIPLDKAGLITVTNAPPGMGPWDGLDYIRQTSSQFATSQISPCPTGNQPLQR